MKPLSYVLVPLIEKVMAQPAEAILCATCIIGVLAFWPWKDNRAIFSEIQKDCEWRDEEDCCMRSENWDKDYVCCSAVCPILKREKENSHV